MTDSIDIDGKVAIIVEPFQNTEKFFSDTVRVYIIKALKSNVIAKAEMIDIRSDLRRKVVIIEFKKMSMVETIKQMIDLCDYKIKCYQPVSL